MRKCPKCKKYKTVIKYGKAKNGKQRYKCKKCNYQFTRPLRIEYSNEIKYRATFLFSLKGFSYTLVAKLLKIDSRYKVRYWVQTIGVKKPSQDYLRVFLKKILRNLYKLNKTVAARQTLSTYLKTGYLTHKKAPPKNGGA